MDKDLRLRYLDIIIEDEMRVTILRKQLKCIVIGEVFKLETAVYFG